MKLISRSKEELKLWQTVLRNEVQRQDLDRQVCLPHLVLDLVVPQQQEPHKEYDHEDYEECVEDGVLLDELRVVVCGRLCHLILDVGEHVVHDEMLHINQGDCRVVTELIGKELQGPRIGFEVEVHLSEMCEDDRHCLCQPICQNAIVDFCTCCDLLGRVK